MVCCDLGLRLDIRMGIPAVIQIENPRVAVQILRDLGGQLAGQEGQIVFSQNDKELNPTKELELIWNPLSLTFDSKQIQTKLYQELREIASESFPEESAELRGNLVRYLDAIAEKIPYQIDYCDEFDIIGLFKLADVQLAPATENLGDLVTDYIRIVSQFCRKKVVVFLNLCQYFTKEELDSLFSGIRYLEVYPVLLEVHNEKILSADIIIDSDKCVI